MDVAEEEESEPCWLSGPEQAAWRSLNSLTIRLRAALEADLERSAGLNLFEYLVLSGLSEEPGWTLRMSELSARADSSLSRLSHAVSRLEKRGWVTRAPDPQDGRYIEARLTRLGWDKTVASAPAHVRAVRRSVIDPLDAQELRQLQSACEKVLDGLSRSGAGAGRGASAPPAPS